MLPLKPCVVRKPETLMHLLFFVKKAAWIVFIIRAEAEHLLLDIAGIADFAEEFILPSFRIVFSAWRTGRKRPHDLLTSSVSSHPPTTACRMLQRVAQRPVEKQVMCLPGLEWRLKSQHTL